MMYYKMTAQLAKEQYACDIDSRKAARQHAGLIASKAEDFKQSRGGRDYFFVSGIVNESIICGIISVDSDITAGDAQAFLNALGFDVTDVTVNEITFSSLCNLLSRAENNSYIEDDYEVLEKFGLEGLSRRYGYFNFTENILMPSVKKTSLYETAGKLCADKTLSTELDRIFSERTNPGAYGHPVHYFVETNNTDTEKELTYTLLSALSQNNRLKSIRYCTMDINPGNDLPRSRINTLYKSLSGAAIILRYCGGSTEDSNYSNGEIDTIQALCEATTKYRNSVLTVFCLPRACEGLKKVFYENLGSCAMMEIKEDLADNEAARNYLAMLCGRRHIEPDDKLFDTLDSDKLYLPDELSDIFDEWYCIKMKTTVFPQYRDIAVSRKKAAKETARGTAFDELQKMVGLHEAKEVIGKALNYYKLQRIYKDKGIKQDRAAMHMVFTGNPGTAKTTAARLFARIMKENGLLSKGHLTEVGRSDLVGKYVGWTADIVKKKFKAAMGGVLFIDEAYSLNDGREGLYGDEAINTIVQEMENLREDMVVIFAGYPREMERFLSRNPGLRSRIAFHVRFADYDAQELCDIARIIGRAKGMTLSDGAVSKLSSVFEEARHQPDFGNGRYVRNVIELSKMNHASRILSMDTDKVTDKMLVTIEESDIEAPQIKTEPKMRTIGFAS